MNKNSKNFCASIYHSFGKVVEERSKSYQNYRFGFNGQECDDEVSGTDGGHLTFKYKLHDARLGRFLSVRIYRSMLTPSFRFWFFAGFKPQIEFVMAGKTKPMSQIKQLLRLHRQGCKIKEISQMLELSRNTVKRYLQKVEAAGWSIEALL